jgi:hypothetical protein
VDPERGHINPSDAMKWDQFNEFRSTASDDYHRESERFGMERDRTEQRERCGNGYVYESLPAPTEIPRPAQSYEEFWAEIVKERDEWWSKWKKEHGF